MATYDEYDNRTPANRAGTLVNYAGAAVSLALIAGVSVWGYKLIVRDVSGIPVVRAMEGAMRIAPQDPGGDVVRHAGLAVNAVAAEGGAAEPGDTLLLAPTTTQLSEEDIAVQPMAEADEVRATDVAEGATEVEVPTALNAEPPADSGPLNADDILALADQIAAGATPMTALAAGESVDAEVQLDGETVTTLSAPAVNPNVPGVAVSLRPVVRPGNLVQATPASASIPMTAEPAAAAPEAVATAAITPASSIPAGTHLVQLGAFPDADQAATEWTRLFGLFSEFMAGKTLVILEATSGGQTFYRLRASGFPEMSDARRFCASLIADNADCIPVVTQ